MPEITFIKDNDTIEVKLNEAGSVTFNVKNKQETPVSGAVVIFNGLSQTTDALGSTTFTLVNAGQAYPYAVTREKYYAGYGILDLKGGTNTRDITLYSDGTPINKTIVKTVKAIFPNPASENIHIVSEEPILTVEIFSVRGSKVYQKTFDTKTISVPLSELKDGEYVLRVTTSKGQESHKIIVKH
ncbi:MAG: T9SS type A sorting domain-containing protein [Bacteroidales bacterium]|nr:T9SS type A sorting domain-containing protein [Bacteroidales bacterium]